MNRFRGWEQLGYASDWILQTDEFIDCPKDTIKRYYFIGFYGYFCLHIQVTSTVFEGSTVTKIENQLLFEGIDAIVQ